MTDVKKGNGKVFLGGTCNNSRWRDALIPLLKVGWFNPVVDHWREEDRARELAERENCSICLYGLTPKLRGIYAVAELVDDSNKRPAQTAFLLLEEDEGERFDAAMTKSLNALRRLVEANGVKTFTDARACADFINGAISANGPGINSRAES